MAVAIFLNGLLLAVKFRGKIVKKYLILSFFLCSNLFAISRESVSLSDFESQIVALTRQIENNDFFSFEENKNPILLSILSSFVVNFAGMTFLGREEIYENRQVITRLFVFSLLHAVGHGLPIGFMAKMNSQVSPYIIGLLDVLYQVIFLWMTQKNLNDELYTVYTMMAAPIMTLIEIIIIMKMNQNPEKKRLIFQEQVSKIRKEFEKEFMKKKALQKEEALSSIEAV